MAVLLYSPPTPRVCLWPCAARGAVGQGQACFGGVEVALQPCDEGVQFRQVVGLGPLHPLLQALTGELHHHLGEGADVLAERGQGGAECGQGLQVLLLVALEGVGVAEEPAGGLGGRWR
ncbi:hypothetical protein ACIG5D_04510 [Microbispora rosea]|uniref:hypothetical protein n=1 Tax=Microbispora rosea TaxID=58117 RepID=UPI0037C5E47D